MKWERHSAPTVCWMWHHYYNQNLLLYQVKSYIPDTNINIYHDVCKFTRKLDLHIAYFLGILEKTSMWGVNCHHFASDRCLCLFAFNFSTCFSQTTDPIWNKVTWVVVYIYLIFNSFEELTWLLAYSFWLIEISKIFSKTTCVMDLSKL